MSVLIAPARTALAATAFTGTPEACFGRLDEKQSEHKNGNGTSHVSKLEFQKFKIVLHLLSTVLEDFASFRAQRSFES